MSGSREEERRKLADIINHWNANRLDLFEISRPTEVGDQPWVAGEAADPQGLSWVNVDPIAAAGWHLGRACWKPSCCGQRGLLGLLRGKSPVRAWRARKPNSIQKSGDLARRFAHPLHYITPVILCKYYGFRDDWPGELFIQWSAPRRTFI